MKTRGGFSLIEVLLASAVSLTLLVALGTFYIQTRRQISVSFEEVQATFMGRELLDQCHAVLLSLDWGELKKSVTIPSKKSKFIEYNTAKPDVYLFPKSNNPAIRSLSRLLLSPAGDRFRRSARIFYSNQSPLSGFSPASDLITIEVLVEWKHTSKEFNRSITLTSVVGENRIANQLER